MKELRTGRGSGGDVGGGDVLSTYLKSGSNFLASEKCIKFSCTGPAGRTRGGAMAHGMAMAQDGTTTGDTWDIMATLASTGDWHPVF